jgi:hypothetical protein
MIRFNEIFSQKWHSWFQNSPWSRDEFLSERVPVGLSVRYGQDISICAPGTARALSDAWDQQRRWKDLHYVSLALATHIRAHQCQEVREIPLEDILQRVNENGWRLFDSWDETNRHEIESLEDYPCFNPDGQENRIYNEHGRRIPRVEYYMDPNDERNAGVLIDLGEITSLFSSSNHRLAGDRSSPSCQVTLYPQSFVSQMGHVKASGVIQPFQEVINWLNSEIEELWEENEDDLGNNLPAVSPVSCQFYNELSHRLAPRSGNQEVQKGDQTAAMASGYLHTTSACQTRANRLYQRCHSALPFERHQQLLDTTLGITPTDLRAENVFCVDLLAFPEEQRTGR